MAHARDSDRRCCSSSFLQYVAVLTVTSSTTAPKMDSKNLEKASPRSNDVLARYPTERNHGPEDEELHRTASANTTALKANLSNVVSRTYSRITNRNIVDPGPAPDGGGKAWIQVAMAWLVCLTTWGYVNSFGVFNTYYRETLGETQSTISWVGSIQLWIIFVVSVFSGRALDAGLFLPTFVVGSAIQVIGIFTNSLCTEFWQLVLAQGLCTGLGSGIIFCPAMGIVTTYFEKKRGLAVAIVSTGNSFGGAIYPVVVRSLLPQIGFPWTVRVLGFINLACLACAAAFMRPRLPPRKAGAIIEWQAFREVPYSCMIAGMSLVFGGLFFTYYYVRISLQPITRAILLTSHSSAHTAAMSSACLIVNRPTWLPSSMALGSPCDFLQAGRWTGTLVR